MSSSTSHESAAPGKPKYAPEPWTVQRVDYEKDVSFEVLAADGTLICQTIMREVETESDLIALDKAHCDLIAAAGDMHAALRKVPILRPTNDHLGYECSGCGAVSGITRDGADRDEKCAPDCYVPIVEAALAKATPAAQRVTA
jgi:hypothetical protein